MAEYWADAAYGAGGDFAGVSWNVSILWRRRITGVFEEHKLTINLTESPTSPSFTSASAPTHTTARSSAGKCSSTS